jgi:hypothetical protein
MKLKVHALITALVLIAATGFTQDAGNPDTAKMVVTSPDLQVGIPSQPFTLDAYVYVDVNELFNLQFAFKWDYVDMVLDSIVASPAFDSMDIGPFFYLDSDIGISNDSNIAYFSGTSIFTNWKTFPTSRRIATAYFTVNNWSASRGTIVIDTVQHPSYASTDYIFNPAGGNSDYNPVWGGQIVITTSGINDSDPDNIPTTFELQQNFPNPFNPTTTIKFGLPTKSQVSLRVYNLLGQEIATLVDQEVSAGTHTAEWDGKDKTGVDVASGIYFYKLIADDFIETKKMMLVK